MRVLINDIDLTSPLQAREETHAETVEFYSGLVKEGKTLPSLLVYRNPPGSPKTYSLLDGLQTAHALLNEGIDSVEVEVTEMTSDLERFAEGVKRNSKHGLPFSAKDRKRIIEKMFKMTETHQWSDGYIAGLVGCSDRTVANYRKQHSTPKFSGLPEERRFIKEGKIFSMKIPTAPTDTPPSSPVASTSQSSDTAEPKTLLERAQQAGQLSVPYTPLMPDTTPQYSHHLSHQGSEDSELPLETKKTIIEPLRELAGTCNEFGNAFYTFSDNKEGTITDAYMERLENILRNLVTHSTRAADAVAQARSLAWSKN